MDLQVHIFNEHMLQDIQINFGRPISQTSSCELTEHLVDASIKVV
jgi:hypothetical protein